MMQKEVYEFISKKTNDPIIERRTCRVNGEEFAITQKDKEFYEKISPTFDKKKFHLPYPTLSPEERSRRRLLFKNDRSLHRGTCGLTGASIITIYNPELHTEIYNIKDRWSDKRDPLEYGHTWDESQSFLSQYFSLQEAVPKIAMVNDNGIGSENCEYTQDVAYAKNCYLTVVAWKIENAHYSSNMAGGRWLIDNFFVMDSENCYECVDSYNLHTCFRLKDSSNSHGCWFGVDLIGCKDCLLCLGLQNQQYCIMNKQYTKEEYERHKQQFQKDVLHDVTSIKQRFDHFVQQFPKKAMHIIRADDVSYGTNLVNAENAIYCYNIKNVKDCRYCAFGDTMTKSYDLTVGGEPEWCYEGLVPDNSYRTCFTIFCRSCTNVWYSEMCHHCQDCFGCVGLKNQKYCILNKQYTKETYEETVAIIIESMIEDESRGEFFPPIYTPFGYNETNASEYFPLEKEEIVSNGYRWYERDKEVDVPDEIEMLTSDIIKKYNSKGEKPIDILDKAIIGEISGRPFKMIPQEIEFYTKYGLPLPTKHSDTRVLERVVSMPQKILYLRACDKTGEEILSVYPPNTSFKVYSEEVYRQEMYG